MDLEEIKNMWGDYDEKLDKNLQLNLQLLKRMNFDKAKFRMRWLLVLKTVEMCWLFFLVQYFADFTIRNFSEPRFCIPAIILGLVGIGYFALDVVQLSLIMQLQLKDNDQPVSSLQKATGRLKYMLVTQLKCSLFMFPLYTVMMILIAKIFLNVDFFSPYLRASLVTNIVFGLVLLPAVIWVYHQLSQKEINKRWIKQLLTGIGWHLVNDAEVYLAEITEFEKEG
jgi:hypothetical protein